MIRYAVDSLVAKVVTINYSNSLLTRAFKSYILYAVFSPVHCARWLLEFIVTFSYCDPLRRFWWSIIHALESGLRLDACNVRKYLYLYSYSLHQNWKSICARLISSSWSRFYIISYVLSLWLRLVFFLLYRFLNNRNNPLWVQPCSIATAKNLSKLKAWFKLFCGCCLSEAFRNESI